MEKLDPRMVEAIAKAVLAAIDAVGIDGIREMSMFPSSQKDVVSFKMAA